MSFSVLTLTFIAINLDFFIVLIFLLQEYSVIKVMIGYALAVFTLLLVGFLVGDILERFLPEWLLGVLGVLPIYMAFKDEDAESKVVTNSATYAVFITYLSVCSGCVLSLFVPVLIGKSWLQFGTASLYLLCLTVMIVLLAKAVESNHVVQAIIELHGEWLMKVCYIIIGIYVLFDSGFVAHLIKFL